MNIDWSKAPEGATHFFGFEPNRLNSWWKVSTEKAGPPAFVYSPIDGEWVAMALIPNDILPIPDHKPWIGEGLPPLESTVRIVPGNTVIWDVAEQFVGVDCRLKAVFMLGETRMVAVECIESGQCCCFWASMVRTPEQAKEEEREAGIEKLLDWVAAQTKVDRSEVYRKNWAVLYDAGLRPPVKP